MHFLATGSDELRRIPLIELIPLVGIPVYWILGFVVFAAICFVAGQVPSTERIARTQSRALPRIVLEYGYWQLRIPVRILRALRFTPNMVTCLSLVIAIGSGVAFALGRFGIGGWALAASAACDALDGIIARETGTSSDRGEYFDAFVDRYADFVVMLGILAYYRDSLVPALLTMLAMVGSQAMGYAKAKGEAVGIDPKVGYMQRHERCVYLLVAAVFSPIVAAFVEPGAAHPTYHPTVVVLALVAVLTNYTAVWRALYVMQRMPAPPAPAAPARVEPLAGTAAGALASPLAAEPAPSAATSAPRRFTQSPA